MTFLDTLPAGVWMTQSGVWMFVPTVASSADVWKASEFLDNLANAKYEAELAEAVHKPAQSGVIR